MKQGGTSQNSSQAGGQKILLCCVIPNLDFTTGAKQKPIKLQLEASGTKEIICPDSVIRRVFSDGREQDVTPEQLSSPVKHPVPQDKD